MKYQTRIFLLAMLCSFLHTQDAELIKKDHRSPKLGLRNLVEIEGEVFWFSAGEYISWNQAHQKCSEVAMQLVTLDTQERNDMILNWIGNNPDYDFWYWTSGTKPEWSTWRWLTTEQNFTFSSWAEGQPSRLLEEESCMDFATWNNGWDDDYCDGIGLQYICENWRTV